MLQIIRKLLYIIPASKASLAGIMFLFIFSSTLEIVGIGAIAPFIDLAGNPAKLHNNTLLSQLFKLSDISSENQFIAYLGLATIALFCTKVFVAWLTQVIIYRFSGEQQKILIDRLIESYLFFPYTYHLENSSSDVIDNVIESANRFNSIVQSLFVIISNSIIAIALFLLLWYTSSTVMLTLLVVLLPVMLLINSFKQKIRRWGKDTRESKAQLIRTINHSLGGIKETKVIGCEQYFKNQVLQQTRNLESSQTSFFSFNTMPRYLIEASMLLSTVGMISFLLITNNDINQFNGVLGVYALASIRFMPAFAQVTSGINTLRNNSYTIDRICFDLKKSAFTAASEGKANIQTNVGSKLVFQRKIELSNISYRYPNQKEFAIKNLSLNIKQGESIAFIGKSGSGKTTLADIVLGLLIVKDGDIRVDGVSIYKNLRSWQNLVAYIPQSIFLADDTIERNIAFGVPDQAVDLDRIYRVIQTAQLSEVIDNLPDGIKTRVGERGILLSGGQRQRIGIARALYHEREVLVLDEATAALDSETEKLVADAINALSGKKTLITIAHRLSTVEKCDRIFQLEKGMLIDSGNYQEVVASKR